jgi:5-methyltetrahydrofolate--homocysteine methyltransferase
MSVIDIVGGAGGTPVIAKANAGIPHFHGDAIQYSGTPELMADYARLAADSGARIIGGCCGSTAAHVRAMRAALDGYSPGGPPDRAAVETALGALVAPRSTAPARERQRRRG